KPHVDYLRVFGCLGYVYLNPEEHANKLTLRSHACIHVGVSDSGNGYKFLTGDWKLKITTNMVFDEMMFPKRHMF
ncbi:hypothetical protein CONPUDRAFT_54696, partial [Coniophora puteana RWD-64-598 SS2]